MNRHRNAATVLHTLLWVCFYSVIAALVLYFIRYAITGN